MTVCSARTRAVASRWSMIGDGAFAVKESYTASRPTQSLSIAAATNFLNRPIRSAAAIVRGSLLGRRLIRHLPRSVATNGHEGR